MIPLLTDKYGNRYVYLDAVIRKTPDSFSRNYSDLMEFADQKLDSFMERVLSGESHKFCNLKNGKFCPVDIPGSLKGYFTVYINTESLCRSKLHVYELRTCCSDCFRYDIVRMLNHWQGYLQAKGHKRFYRTDIAERLIQPRPMSLAIYAQSSLIREFGPKFSRRKLRHRSRDKIRSSVKIKTYQLLALKTVLGPNFEKLLDRIPIVKYGIRKTTNILILNAYDMVRSDALENFPFDVLVGTGRSVHKYSYARSIKRAEAQKIYEQNSEILFLIVRKSRATARILCRK